MQIETQEAAVFESVNSALAFALNFRHGQIKTTGLATLMAGSKPAGRGLGGLDGAGTAAFIRCEIEAIEPKVRGQILVARFAVRAVKCECGRQCCSGFAHNPEWLKAVAYISDTVRSAALAGCAVNLRLRHAMVSRYFGVKQGLAEAAIAAGVDRDTASAHSNRVIGYLKGEEQHARYAIEGRLKAAGIVE